MMRTKTKIEIIVQTRQRITLRGHNMRSVWCQTCGTAVWVVSLEQAALVSQATAGEIYRRLERGNLHFVITCEGGVSICGNSIEQCERQTIQH